MAKAWHSDAAGHLGKLFKGHGTGVPTGPTTNYSPERDKQPMDLLLAARRQERLPGEVYRPTRRDIDPETGLPDPDVQSRNHWRVGECWLWCGQGNVDVTWIGPAQSSGMHADLYACRACLYELDQRILRINLGKDRQVLRCLSPGASASVRPPAPGRHRRPR